jgi:hypothetical protein
VVTLELPITEFFLESGENKENKDENIELYTPVARYVLS